MLGECAKLKYSWSFLKYFYNSIHNAHYFDILPIHIHMICKEIYVGNKLLY